MNRSITLNFDNRSVELNADYNSMFNLNKLHQASGTSANRRPGSWLRSAAAQQLIQRVGRDAQISATVVKRGGMPSNQGTWALEQVVYAYAEWLSPEFHQAVIEAFTAAANGDGDGAVRTAQSVVRVAGINTRKKFTSALASCGASQGDFGTMTDTVYLQMFGLTAQELRERYNVPRSGKLRDYLSDQQLASLDAAEAVINAMILKSPTKNRSVMRAATHRGSMLTASALV